MFLVRLRLVPIKKAYLIGKPRFYVIVYTISSTPTELFVRKVMMMMCSCILHCFQYYTGKSKALVLNNQTFITKTSILISNYRKAFSWSPFSFTCAAHYFNIVNWFTSFASSSMQEYVLWASKSVHFLVVKVRI